MEFHKLISDILEGKARVLSFDNVAFDPNKDINAVILSALNFMRLAFAAEQSTPIISQILALLCSRKTVDNALGICRDWSSDVHVQVEDICRIPLFEESLKLVSTDYDFPSSDHFMGLLENLRTLGPSAAVLVTRYPDVVTCLRLRVHTQDIFILFRPQVKLEHEEVAILMFNTSLPQIAQCLHDIFPLDKGKGHLVQANYDCDTKLIEKCTGYVFVPRITSYDAHIGEESLMISSLTLLTLRAELEGLTHDNGSLKKEKQRLEKSIVELQAQLQDGRTKVNSAQSSRQLAVKGPRGPSREPAPGPRLTQPFRSTREPEYFYNREDETDPSFQLALQLQATFDSENELLLKQRHQLLQTAQFRYTCGICLDDFPEDDAIHINACGHEICRDCLRGHVYRKIEEHRFPVLCPICMADHKNRDPGIISSTLVELLGLPEEQWATWVEMEMAQYSIPFDCRKCHHSGFVDRVDLDAQSEIHCPFPACNHVWCKKCLQTIEPGGPDPSHSCDGASELDHLMKQQGWRYCPNCKTPIQKLQGCNHVSCIAPGCNTHFCYRCGETINRTAIPREILEGKTTHFRSCALF